MGESEEPTEVWDGDAFAEFTKEFISEFTDEPAVLLGHSFGGRTILKMLEKNWYKNTKIILIDSAGLVPKKTFASKMKVKKYKLAKKLVTSAPIRKIAPEALEELQKAFGSEDYKNSSPIMRGCLVKAVNEDMRESFPKITNEVLIIWGTEDHATPISDGQLMEELIPKAGLAKIEGAGHYSFLDNRVVFNAILSSYLKLEGN
jgi:pimeloyl-ACP methyl ester carboxylesterase